MNSLKIISLKTLRMKIYILFTVFFLSFPCSITRSYCQSTDLSGYKIFINPGHGGYDSDDRHMLTTDYWESEGNLVKGLYLQELLTKMNATVYMSRTTNTTADDLALSVIDAMANASNADFFLSIHSNGWDGTQNQPLMLFRGYDDAPIYDDAKTMATILWHKIIEKNNCWTDTTEYVKGDWTYYPNWGYHVGLGVLRTLQMPGVLCEGSFHDYVPESWRLRNTNYLHHEAWAFLRTFTQFYNINPVSYGIVAGVIRDTLITPEWYFKTGTRDEKMPLNNVKVTLQPGNKICKTDTLNNGYFFFDSIAPGNYKLYFEGTKDYYKDSSAISVIANKTTLADFYLQFDTLKTPEITGFSPEISDSISFNQGFTLTFSIPMNTDSVQKAIHFNPGTDVNFKWENDNKTVNITPVTGFSSKTNYLLTLNASACSKWNIQLNSSLQYPFVTKYRKNLNIEKTYPADTLKAISLYPQIRIYFDAPVKESSAKTGINLLTPQGETLSKKNEIFTISGTKGAYYFETTQPLDLNTQYILSIDAGVTDTGGYSTGITKRIPFKTRRTNYYSGNVVEFFETISNFWDPETSGSTVGTNNPLTTFTASGDNKFSGNYSGQLNYSFTGTSGGICRVYNTSEPSVGSDLNSIFGIWVFGDLSYNILQYWFTSSGVTSYVYVDTINWAGWEFKSIPFSNIGFSGKTLFNSITLIQTPLGNTTGTLRFDDAMVYTSTGIKETTNQIQLECYPNPIKTTGKIIFTVNYQAKITIDLYYSDGRPAKNITSETFQAGKHEINWTPSIQTANGIYIMKLRIQSLNDGHTEIQTQKLVIIR
jgi:N-acetylmuramoyl-L-alanine amidase